MILTLYTRVEIKGFIFGEQNNVYVRFFENTPSTLQINCTKQLSSHLIKES